MIEGTNPKLIREWMQYAEIDPFGEERADVRNAMLLQFLSSAFGSKQKTKLSDFMPQFNRVDEKPKPKTTPQQQESLLRKYFK